MKKILVLMLLSVSGSSFASEKVDLRKQLQFLQSEEASIMKNLADERSLAPEFSRMQQDHYVYVKFDNVQIIENLLADIRAKIATVLQQLSEK